jgi:hypothetical protein
MNDPEEMLKLLAKYKNTTRNDLILSLLLAKMNVIESGLCTSQKLPEF